MKFARLGPPGREIPVLEGDEGGWHDLRQVTADIDGTFLSGRGPVLALAGLRDGVLPRVEDAEDLRFGPPIARPGKIVCIGLNYRDHAAEVGAPLQAEPVVFLKDPATVVGPHDPVRIPRGSVKTDWEIELGVVVGRTARYLASPADALEHVGGYTISHDVCEREFQLERGGQWDKGKSCETFNPLGPWLVTPAHVSDPQSLAMRLTVNAVQRQQGNTANMVFGVAYLIWYLSQFMVLYPGDLINTGTPAGVALGRPATPYLRAGDVVELTIEGLGAARQEVLA